MDAPFVMAAINTRNVLRSNVLLGCPWGEDFVYDEMVMTGPGEKGEQIARGMAAAGSGMDGKDAPKPGEGPAAKSARTASTMWFSSASRPDGARCWPPSGRPVIQATAPPRR